MAMYEESLQMVQGVVKFIAVINFGVIVCRSSPLFRDHSPNCPRPVSVTNCSGPENAASLTPIESTCTVVMCRPSGIR